MTDLHSQLLIHAKTNKKIKYFHRLTKLISSELDERRWLEWERRVREMDHILLYTDRKDPTIAHWEAEIPWELEDKELVDRKDQLRSEIVKDLKTQFPNSFRFVKARVSTEFVKSMSEKVARHKNQPHNYPELMPLVKRFHLRPYDILILESNQGDELYLPVKSEDIILPFVMRSRPCEIDFWGDLQLTIFVHPDGLLVSYDDRISFSYSKVEEIFAELGVDVFGIDELYNHFTTQIVYGIKLTDKKQVEIVLEKLESDSSMWQETLNSSRTRSVKLKGCCLYTVSGIDEIIWFITALEIEPFNKVKPEQIFRKMLSEKEVTIELGYYIINHN